MVSIADISVHIVQDGVICFVIIYRCGVSRLACLDLMGNVCLSTV